MCDFSYEFNVNHSDNELHITNSICNNCTIVTIEGELYKEDSIMNTINKINRKY